MITDEQIEIAIQTQENSRLTRSMRNLSTEEYINYQMQDVRVGQREDMLRALEAYEESKWQTIECAPRDGTKITAFGKYYYPNDKDFTEYQFDVAWDNGFWRGCCEMFTDTHFSYWQFRPALPKVGVK